MRQKMESLNMWPKQIRSPNKWPKQSHTFKYVAKTKSDLKYEAKENSDLQLYVAKKHYCYNNFAQTTLCLQIFGQNNINHTKHAKPRYNTNVAKSFNIMPMSNEYWPN